MLSIRSSILGVLLLVSCSAAVDPSTVPASDAGKGDSGSSLTTGLNAQTPAEVVINKVTRPSSFEKSSFSEFIYIDKVAQKILIDWDFFPSTDYDSSAKTLTLPCDVEVNSSTPEGLTFSENVPLTLDDCDEITLDLSNAAFAVYGLIFDFQQNLTVLSDDFGVVIASSGFKTSEGDAIVLDSATNADLAAVVSKL